MSPTQASARSSVVVGAPGVSIAPGDHICAFYPTLTERDDILMPYLREGLRQGDKCIGVLDTSDIEEVRSVLACDVAEGRASVADQQQLDLWHSKDTYLADGMFAVERMLDFWDWSVGGAIQAGYPSARAVGEMTWALSNMPGVEQLVGYEAKLNQLLPHYPQAVVCCLYELDRFDGEVLVDVLKTHPKVLLGGIVLDNPYYLEPEEFLASR